MPMVTGIFFWAIMFSIACGTRRLPSGLVARCPSWNTSTFAGDLALYCAGTQIQYWRTVPAKIRLWNSNGPSSRPRGTPGCGSESALNAYSPAWRVVGVSAARAVREAVSKDTLTSAENVRDLCIHDSQLLWPHHAMTPPSAIGA